LIFVSRKLLILVSRNHINSLLLSNKIDSELPSTKLSSFICDIFQISQ